MHNLFDSEPPSQDTQTISLDLRTAPVQYLNDLEHNSQYKKWSRSLKDFLRPAYPQQLRKIAKNAFTAHFFLNPSLPADMKLLADIQAMIKNNIPVRFGIILTSLDASFTPNSWEFSKGFPSRFLLTPETAAQNVAVILIRAYALIKDEADQNEAIAWLVDMHKSEKLTVETVKEAFVEKYGDNQWV